MIVTTPKRDSSIRPNQVIQTPGPPDRRIIAATPEALRQPVSTAPGIEYPNRLTTELPDYRSTATTDLHLHETLTNAGSLLQQTGSRCRCWKRGLTVSYLPVRVVARTSSTATVTMSTVQQRNRSATTTSSVEGDGWISSCSPIKSRQVH